MKRVIAFAVLAVLGLLVAKVVRPADQVTITEFVTFAKQDAPVQVIGFKLPDKAGTPKVLVRNTTTKSIDTFALSILYGDPRNGGPGQLVLSDDFNPMGGSLSLMGCADPHVYCEPDRTISPSGMLPDDGYKELPEPVLSATKHATRVDSNCVHLVLVVSDVLFKDHSRWQVDPRGLDDFKADGAVAQSLWRDSIRPESATGCNKSPEVENTMERSITESWSAALPRSSSETVQSYSVKCPVNAINGQLTARCNLQ